MRKDAKQNMRRLVSLITPTALKSCLRDGAFHRWLQRRADEKELAAWSKSHVPRLPPQSFKKRLIRDLAKKLGYRVLVETGTHWGNTVAASIGRFEMIYSIELSNELHQHAKRRFARHRNVKLYHGDSAVELPRILDDLQEPALFWLDAHYSGEGTARAQEDTPIMRELLAISEHSVRTHLILIDDARCFDGTNDYPTIEACRTLAAQVWPTHQFAVENDVIQITPR